MKRKKKKEHCLNVSYSSHRHGWGMLDGVADKISRGKAAGAGTCMLTGYRDLDYVFTNHQAAYAAHRRFKADHRFRTGSVSQW